MLGSSLLRVHKTAAHLRTTQSAAYVRPTNALALQAVRWWYPTHPGELLRVPCWRARWIPGNRQYWYVRVTVPIPVYLLRRATVTLLGALKSSYHASPPWKNINTSSPAVRQLLHSFHPARRATYTSTPAQDNNEAVQHYHCLCGPCFSHTRQAVFRNWIILHPGRMHIRQRRSKGLLVQCSKNLSSAQNRHLQERAVGSCPEVHNE
ncbi:hypothetical protein DE146DRAFT_40669 [Phaeosphaeria sp. MPI-PUGE-AT-0046c]|nr:hypothetical protein DE146DRAFT_40669 [Phaeosphaeria sp. MPI-PUGE-AT-0046c]